MSKSKSRSRRAARAAHDDDVEDVNTHAAPNAAPNAVATTSRRDEETPQAKKTRVHKVPKDLPPLRTPNEPSIKIKPIEGPVQLYWLRATRADCLALAGAHEYWKRRAESAQEKLKAAERELEILRKSLHALEHNGVKETEW